MVYILLANRTALKKGKKRESRVEVSINYHCHYHCHIKADESYGSYGEYVKIAVTKKKKKTKTI